MGCNLELGLLPSSTSLASTTSTISSGSTSNEHSSNQEQMTIFYNGRICVCDVTEVQARCIISLANISNTTAEGKCRSPTGGENLVSPRRDCQQLYTQNGLSMKKSLRQFLEKRKHRVQATSPYYYP